MKKNLMKQAFSVVAVTAMVASMTACGGKQAAPSSTPTSAAETVAVGETSAPKEVSGQTLKVLISEEPGDEDALSIALNTWAEETGNKIERMILSHDDQLTKFPAMAKNRDLPDLISTTRLHQLYSDEFVDMATVLDLSKFNDSAAKIVGKSFTEDKISGAPEQFTITCMYYNQEAFEKAGMEVPTAENPWTWEELYANAKVIQEKAGIKYGFAADVSRARYDILMYANGGSLVQADGDIFKVAVNSADNVATLEAFVNANNEGTMPKAIWAGGTTDNPVEYFKNGDAAILLSGSWNYNTFTNDISKFTFGVMTTPKGSVSQAAIIGGAALAIPENAKGKDAAIAFIQWFYEDEHYQQYLQNHKGLSVMDALGYHPDGDKAKEDYKIMQNELNYVTDTFMVDESSSWRTYKDNEYRDNLKKAVAGELTAKEALDGFGKELAEASGWEMAE